GTNLQIAGRSDQPIRLGLDVGGQSIEVGAWNADVLGATRVSIRLHDEDTDIMAGTIGGRQWFAEG
ncbi:MAG TPA: hypothetical protein VNT26_19630, partial [Candidatus Sulfotelmatobacter sp.]|nr:hypothetical protein [Candidatus Sulfotelmatobacter sp.]